METLPNATAGLTDGERLRAIAAGTGTHGHWEALWEAYAYPCFRIALRMIKDENGAWSAVNEAWGLAFEGLSSEIRSFPAWITTITRNVSLNHIRRRQRRSAREMELKPWHYSALATANDPAERLRGEEALQAVVTCATLSEQEREFFLLHCLLGLAYEEIARVAGVPTGTVSSYIHRARKKLRSSEKIQRLLLPLIIAAIHLLTPGGLL